MWTVSGFYFTLFPIEVIHGDHLRADVNHGQLSSEQNLLSLDQIRSEQSEPVQSMELTMFHGDAVWNIVYESGRREILDATTGDPLTPFNEIRALQIVRSSTNFPPDELFDVQLIESNPPREYAGPLPAYQFTRPSGQDRFYVPAETGELKSVRTNEWRVFDVLWRFHIMDATGADRFDSWWLRLFAGSAVLFVLTGFVLLIHRSGRKRLFR